MLPVAQTANASPLYFAKSALHLARDKELHVFRIERGTKDRFVDTEWNRGAATADLVEVLTRFAFQEYNVGVWCGAGLLVIDVDAHHGGLEAWDALVQEIGPVPETFTVRTPNGGLHLYFNRGTERFGQAQLVKGKIDVRADGGYVVGPGSEFNGRPYVIEKALPIAPLPDTLRARLRASTKTETQVQVVADLDTPANLERAERYLAHEAPHVAEGGRNNELYKVACKFGDFGLSEEIALDFVRRWNDTHCAPPLDDAELEHSTRSSFQRRTAHVGRDAPGLGFTPVKAAKPSVSNADDLGLVVRRMSEIKMKPMTWLWPHFIPGGKLSLLAGKGGLGKTTVLLDITARISRGLEWPHGAGKARCGSIIYLSAEDDPADTLAPRLAAAGADTDKVHLVESSKGADGTRKTFNLKADLEKLEALIERIGDVVLVVFDPISSYFGDADTFKNTEVRAVLEPLVALAARCNVSIIGNTHLSKSGKGNDANMQVLDSVAMTATGRVVNMVVQCPDDRDQRIFGQTKNNNARMGDGIRFTISDKIVDEAQEIRGSYIAWGDREGREINELISANAQVQKPAPKLEQASEFVLQHLADGRVHTSTNIFEAGTNAGHTTHTIRCALNELKQKGRIRYGKQGGSMGGHWVAQIPEGA